MKDLLCKNQFESISSQYADQIESYLLLLKSNKLQKESHLDTQSKLSAETLLKLLLRAQRMEYNKSEITKILNLCWTFKQRCNDLMVMEDANYPAHNIPPRYEALVRLAS